MLRQTKSTSNAVPGPSSPTGRLVKARSSQAAVAFVPGPVSMLPVEEAAAPLAMQATSPAGSVPVRLTPACTNASDEQLAVARSMLRFVRRPPAGEAVSSIPAPVAKAASSAFPPPSATVAGGIRPPADKAAGVLPSKTSSCPHDCPRPHNVPPRQRPLRRQLPFQPVLLVKPGAKPNGAAGRPPSWTEQMVQTDRLMQALVDDPSRERSLAAQRQVVSSFAQMAHELASLGQRVHHLERRGAPPLERPDADPATKLPSIGRGFQLTLRDVAAASLRREKVPVLLRQRHLAGCA